MAITRYATEYKKNYVDKPEVPAAPGVFGGVVKCIRFEYDLAVLGTVLAIEDVIKLGVIPKGATVLEAVLHTPDLGSSVGHLNMGWAASAELAPLTGVTVEAANETGFFSNLDVHAAAALNRLAAGAAGALKTFAGDVVAQIQVEEATDGVTTGIIKGYITYVVV